MKGKFTIRTKQFSISKILLFALLVVTLLKGIPKRLWASSILSTGFEITEMMMEAQGAEVGLIGRLFGPDLSSPLSFTSNVDVTNKSFIFDLDPGTTYLGNSINLNVSGTFNPDTSLYEWMSVGSLGSTSWCAAGIGDPDPSIEWESDEIVFLGLKIKLDLKASGDFDVKITPEGETVTSWWKYIFTINGGEFASGKGKDKYDGKNWTWELGYVPELGIAIASSGSSPESGGTGSFVAMVSPVPEPSTWLLFGTGLVGLIGLSFRKKHMCLG